MNIDQSTYSQNQLRKHQSAERVRGNLQKLNSDVDEKRKKLKSTQITISKIMLEEDKRQKKLKEKLYFVQERREIEQQMKSIKLQEQLESAAKRLEQKRSERQLKKDDSSVKDIFIKKRAQEDLDKLLRKYEAHNFKAENKQNQDEHIENSMMNSNMENMFFNLTAPTVQTNSMAEKVFQQMKSQIPQKRQIREKQKQQLNPFYNKQNWDRFMEAERNGEQNIRFPGIGIERTPLYEMQQQEIEKKKKKEEALLKLKKYYLNPSKNSQIDFEQIYKRVKLITSQSLATLKLNPSDTLLGHMMGRSIHDARRIWGKDFLRSKSQYNFNDRALHENNLSSIKEDHTDQNSERIKEKIHSFSKINSSNPNSSILRQQLEETQLQSVMNQQAENSISFPADDQNESMNTKRDKIFKENILQSDIKL
ncbi:hypothetical protein TTHERM_00191290 (macronuclear) [Tetrahymena thermophila SB210]|uniref:Uncharacterized protein n=1 Tax=Tetrahymena thermophila (strain SB210) TaxID=312017 RepID=I7MJM7_TETTS|nr:hypothetical protein TTHERM_00191290 [Tetrahymena thermophila SB210]EAR96461.1 hypothetical protein TTHERM_00191290 [Tetrahymena thermophila SB210]|eukprot:XP_001016706.1 hypothetical protein TTHERM_00191290 [Tetrahymena thermophila SB210]